MSLYIYIYIYICYIYINIYIYVFIISVRSSKKTYQFEMGSEAQNVKAKIAKSIRCPNFCWDIGVCEA